ncbi:MAG: acyl-CoA synthetase [Myxococcales bacterium]|nr:acyl-CoA synthetase [Myxococcales bacterium]MCB9606172.1 acyl-CoA synthetase [Polyangiaceae bacterium]
MNVELGFWKVAAEKRNETGIVDPDGTKHSFGEAWDRTNQLVHGLRAQGLTNGDTLAVAAPNSHQVIETFMAAAQAGWRLTPVNWHLTASEIAYILKDSESKVFIASSRFGEAAKKAAAEAGLPADKCFYIGDPIEGFRNFDELWHGQPTTVPEDRSAGGPMTYTSGTTGHPKGVRRPVGQAAPELVATQQALFLSLFGMFPGSVGVHLVVAPLYHTAVLNFATNHLHLGHSVVLMDKWAPEDTLRVIQEHKVTNSHMVPTMFTRMLKLPEDVKARYDVSSLSHVIHSAAPCPIDIKQKMLDWWGDCIFEYYAASEGGGTLATPQDWRKKPGTVGAPWPISQIRVLNDEQQPLAPGEIGTVWIRMGDHKFEYHKDKAKTDKSWHEGFFTVGDAGYLDEDGYLFLCDRKADMIISGGVNIYPAEIEAVFVTHPKVQDVAIFGIPNEDWGEEVMAVIQPTPGNSAGAELESELREFAQDRVAKYKMPRRIEFIAEMPRDPNGKLYKRKLRDPHWEGHDRAI